VDVERTVQTIRRCSHLKTSRRKARQANITAEIPLFLVKTFLKQLSRLELPENDGFLSIFIQENSSLPLKN